MATTYTWHVANLERHTADGIVYTVHWTLDAHDGTYSAGAYGSMGLEPPAEEEAIPFADLTEDTVIGWLQEKFGAEKIAEIEAALQSQLDEQAAPTKAAGLPWA